MLYVECPHCQARYPARNLAAHPQDQPAPGRSFTVLCPSCGSTFDVEFTHRPRRLFGLLPGGLQVMVRRR